MPAKPTTRLLIEAVLASAGEPLTIQQIANEIPSKSYRAVEGSIFNARTLMRNGRKTFRIAQWERTGGNPMPYYVLGEGPDAPKPRTLTTAERSRKANARHRMVQKAKRYVNRTGRPVDAWAACVMNLGAVAL